MFPRPEFAKIIYVVMVRNLAAPNMMQFFWHKDCF